MCYNDYEISELLEVEMLIKHNFFNGLVFMQNGERSSVG